MRTFNIHFAAHQQTINSFSEFQLVSELDYTQYIQMN